jgi:hypothetical protein
MKRIAFVFCAFLFAIGTARPDDKPAKPPKKPPREIKVPGYTSKQLEGFTVLISDETKSHLEDEEFERKPLDVLQLELIGISRVMQPRMLKALQTIAIFVEWDDPESKPKDGGGGVIVARYWYDPGRGMGMAMGGRNPLKANNIEILNMKHLTGKWQPGKSSEQIILLHEMCHAVHSQLLGSDNPLIKAAYNQAMERHLYDNVKHESGRSARAYAATNDHEYFAELCCAYLDRCSWYPFTREELKEHDPVGYELMQKVWTVKDPRKSKSAAKSAKAQQKSETPAKSDPSSAAKTAAPATQSGPAAEAAAARKLDLVDSLINADRKDKAKEKLQEIIDTYPDTAAAKKAKEILAGLMK